mgnify:CR=1 FL=1
MKHYLYFFFCLFYVNVFAQNIPSVTIKDAQDLKLTDLKVTVEIVGNLAVTTYDMKFYNGLNRTLEGELVFPLGEGQTVSGFAMDVNGKMRDAVIVEKELGRVAYETTIRRKIDPGLLEKTEGNNYKACIYPIFRNNHKHIIITFEQELSTLDGKQTYELPLGITHNLDDFSIDFNVFSTQKPIINKASYQGFFFEKEGNAFTASISKNNHAPTKPIVLQIPNKTNQESLHTFNNYFHYYKALQPVSRLKKKPKKITILWDASYSMRYKDFEKEYKVLESYLNYLQDVKVNLITFNSTIQSEKKFRIKDGNASELYTVLKNVQYDGGTKLNLFQNVRINTNEILLFSDGLANLGDFATKQKVPVYTINSLVSANHQQLETIATQSGASYLNVLRLEHTKATQLLKRETYQFLGISDDENIREVYPQQRTNVYQDFSVSGQFTEDTTVKLLFGYGGKISERIPVKVTKTEGTKEVRRLWAKQKLKYLSRAKEENKSEIISLGKRYGLITDYTSMIILDRIQDYARYKIEPPKELSAQFKTYLEFEERAEKRRQQMLIASRKNLRFKYTELKAWYKANFKFDPKVNEGSGKLMTVHGYVEDDEGYPLLGVTIRIKGGSTGTMSDFDGNYKLKARRGQKVIVSYAGYDSKEQEIRSNFVYTKLSYTVGLEDVLINAQGQRRDVKKSTTTVTKNIAQLLQGMAGGVRVSKNSEGSGLIIRNGSEKPGQSNKIAIRGQNAISGNNSSAAIGKLWIRSQNSINPDLPIYIIDGEVADQKTFQQLQEEQIKSINILKGAETRALYGNGREVIVVTTKKTTKNIWDTNKSYIEALQQETTVANAYKKYLEIREYYAKSPKFYLEVADFFHSRNATEIAVTITTNLLELELHNYELLKAAAYKLEYFGRYEMAVVAYEKVLEVRPEEPQSYRDLALAYEHVGKIKESYDLLYKLYDGHLLGKGEFGRFSGIENLVYVELSRLVNKYGKKLKLTAEQRKAFPEMKLDVRIVIDWNQNDTDVDLSMVDPKGEKAYYLNPFTQIGGKLSNDLRQGYGPEEFMVRNAVAGNYDVYVNYFGDRVQKISGPTILKVTMFKNYGKKNEEKTIKVISLNKKRGELEAGSLLFKN